MDVFISKNFYLSFSFTMVKVRWNNPSLKSKSKLEEKVWNLFSLENKEMIITLTSSKSIKPFPSVSLNWVNCSRSLATQSGSENDVEEYEHNKKQKNISKINRQKDMSRKIPCSPSSPPSSLYMSPMYSSILT